MPSTPCLSFPRPRSGTAARSPRPRSAPPVPPNTSRCCGTSRRSRARPSRRAGRPPTPRCPRRCPRRPLPFGLPLSPTLPPPSRSPPHHQHSPPRYLRFSPPRSRSLPRCLRFPPHLPPFGLQYFCSLPPQSRSVPLPSRCRLHWRRSSATVRPTRMTAWNL